MALCSEAAKPLISLLATVSITTTSWRKSPPGPPNARVCLEEEEARFARLAPEGALDDAGAPPGFDPLRRRWLGEEFLD